MFRIEIHTDSSVRSDMYGKECLRCQSTLQRDADRHVHQVHSGPEHVAGNGQVDSRTQASASASHPNSCAGEGLRPGEHCDAAEDAGGRDGPQQHKVHGECLLAAHRQAVHKLVKERRHRDRQGKPQRPHEVLHRPEAYDRRSSRIFKD